MKRVWQKPDPRTYLLTFLPLLASILLHSFVLTPLYLTMISDVSWQNSILPRGIAYFQLALEYAFFWFLFAFLSRTIGKWRADGILFPIFFSCLVRQGLEVVMGYAVMGFPTLQEFYEDELIYTLLQLFFDFLLIAAAILIVKLTKKNRLRILLLAGLPVLFQVVSLVIMFFGYEARERLALLSEAGIDLVFHILCFFAGFGVILLWGRLLEKERLK